MPTRWSLVLAAGTNGSPQTDAALATLCETYWYPLYVFLRGRGYDADDAKDLTQAFFVHVLEKSVFSKADPARGRFRSFLLTSLKHFVANEHDRHATRKRGGGIRILPLEFESAEGRFTLEPATVETPETLFDRTWALTLLDRVLARLRDETERGRPQQFEQLKVYLAGPSERSYAETAAALGVSEGAVKVAVHRLRRRYRDLIREQIAETVSSVDQVDDEIRYLWSAVAK